MVLVDFPLRGWTCPAVILDTPPPDEQPADYVRVQVLPVIEFPEPLTFPSSGAAKTDEATGHTEPFWHWPEYVGPAR